MIRNVIFIIPLLLTACFPNNSDSAADKKAKTIITGTLLGSAIGAGVITSFTPQAGAVGKLAGMAAGGTTGYIMAQELSAMNLSPEDQRTRKASLFMALDERKINQPADWKSKHQKDTNGTIIPTNQYMNDQGQICRNYSEIITTESGRSEAEQTACKYPGGTWVIE